MSGKRNAKELIVDFEEFINDLLSEYPRVFRIGKPIPPEERRAKAKVLLGLAKRALMVIPRLRELEEGTELFQKQVDSFTKKNGLTNNPEEKEPCLT